MAHRDQHQPADEGKYSPETAARFRAAFAYAGMEPKDIADALGLSSRTVHRLRTGMAEVTRELRDRVTHLTGVPTWFMEHGFDPGAQSDDPRLVERVDALDQQMQTVLRIITGRVAENLALTDQQEDHGDRAGHGAAGPSTRSAEAARR